MRVSIELEAFGSTLSQIMSDASAQWRTFIEDPDTELPQDTELHIERHAANDYAAKVFIRMKVE